MSSRKNLIKVSVALLLFNLCLGTIALFSYVSTNYELHKLQNSGSKTVQQVKGETDIPKFDPNYLMSNQTFSSTKSFPNEVSVQQFLEKVNSPLKNYTTQGKKASFWIFSAARGQSSSKWGVVPNLNPGLLLAYLEKEQSLLSLSNYDIYSDPDKRIRTAMGYGCNDVSACETQYFGLVNQLNWAAYQLQFNFNLAGNQTKDVYKINKTITTLDEYSVFLTNEATAANYRYTPHVYWGNYNLWKIIIANGWGVSNQTFNYKDIDKVNLSSKGKITTASTDKSISLVSVENILKKDHKLGDQSEDIKLLQRFLRQEGYFMSKEITGMYGTVTEKAHTNYKRDKGIATTVVNNKCQQLLDKNWKIGDSGQEITDLQQCLQNLGFFDWPTLTGTYGQVSEQSLNNYKKSLEKSPPTSPTPTGCDQIKKQTFKLNESSEDVRQLQQCLKNAGLYNWPSGLTGFYGSYTQKQFEIWKNGNKTTANSCSTLKNTSFKLNETGERVRQLQICMQKDGYYTWPAGVTGTYGSYTQKQFLAWSNKSTAQNSTTSTNKTNTCAQLKKQKWTVGEQSSRVRELQLCMQQNGFFKNAGGASGYFGEVTKKALINWRGYF